VSKLKFSNTDFTAKFSKQALVYFCTPCAGSANDSAGGVDLLDVLDSVLRRDGCRSAADRQLPASLTVPLHDARHSLGRLHQLCSQPSHLRRHELPVQTQLQAGAKKNRPRAAVSLVTTVIHSFLINTIATLALYCP